MKEYFENNEENVQMSDLHHLYYMKKEKCADTTGDIMKKQNDTEDQEQPYLIERFDSYCKKVLQFEVMQYYHVKKIARSCSSATCRTRSTTRSRTSRSMANTTATGMARQSPRLRSAGP